MNINGCAGWAQRPQCFAAMDVAETGGYY